MLDWFSRTAIEAASPSHAAVQIGAARFFQVPDPEEELGQAQTLHRLTPPAWISTQRTSQRAMLSETYYLIRSKTDGSYLVAHPRREQNAATTPDAGFLLMFREDFDALSYLNTHGAAVADRFAVESVAGRQVASLLKRWSFSGVGIVKDPLLPKVEFLVYES